jgi:hypothetical protein
LFATERLAAMQAGMLDLSYHNIIDEKEFNGCLYSESALQLITTGGSRCGEARREFFGCSKKSLKSRNTEWDPKNWPFNNLEIKTNDLGREIVLADVPVLLKGKKRPKLFVFKIAQHIKAIMMER